MKINPTGNVAMPTVAEQSHTPGNEVHVASAGASRSSVAEGSPLHGLRRTRSLPARLGAALSDDSTETKTRRAAGRRLATASQRSVATGQHARSPGVSEIRTPTSSARSEHSVDIGDAHGPVPPGGTQDASMPLAASSQAGVMQRLWNMADIRTLLSQANDHEFIGALRAPMDEANADGDGARLDRLVSHVSALKTHLDSAGLDGALATRFKARLDEVGVTLKALQTDKPLGERATKVIGLNALLAPLPLMIPLMTKPRQQKTEAEIVALMAKAMVEAIGMIRTPTTDNNLLKDRAMARYYANTVQAVEFALPTFVSSLRFLNDSPAFNIAAGAVSTGALFGGFLSKEIRDKYNVWRTGSKHPDLRKAGVALSSETKAALDAVKTAVEMDQQMLNGAKDRFITEHGRELSPHLSKQVAIAVNAYQRIADELAECIGLPAAEGHAQNSDRSAKLALALFSTAVCTATTVLMLPDKIGTVDLASDAAFTSALMFSLMADKNVSRKDALEEFKTFVGLSLVMLAVLAANKAANDFMERGVSGLLVGSIAMSALNLTMPGPVGHAAARGIEALMSMSPSDMLNGLKSIGDRVFQMFAGEQARPLPRSTVRLEELDPDLEGALPAR